MQLLPPPLPTRFPSTHLTCPILRHQQIFQRPLFSAMTTAVAINSHYSRHLDSANKDDDDDDIASLRNRRYDFTSLLHFLSSSTNTTSNSDSASPTSLDPTELRLAESYRAVPAPLWHSLLKSLCSSPSSMSTAYSLVTWLQKHNLCFSVELLYSILIHALGRSEKLYEAFLLSQQQALTPLTYNALIGACARNDDLEKALNLMSRMRRDGYQSDFVNYSLVIQSLTRSNNIDSAMLEKLYEEIEADKIELDSQLLNDIIVGFAKANDVNRAMYFLALIQGNGLSARTATIVAVMSALGNCGRAEEAEAIFEELKEGGLKPRMRAYTMPFLKGFWRVIATGCEWQRSFQVLKEMKNIGRGIEPDNVTWNTLIDCHSKLGHHKKAEKLFEEMQESGCSPCTTTYNIMINSFGEQERWEDVKGLLGKMQSHGLLPNVVTYTTLVDIFGQSGRFNEAIECLEDMKSKGLKPSSTMYNALINAYAQRGLSEQAVHTFRVMRADGLKPSTLALNSLINAFGEDRRDAEAFAVLQYMKENDMKADVVTYTTLMKALIRVEKFDQVPSVYEEMILSKCTPDRKARAMLRSALRYMRQTLRS
ncbi:pentatricopeptide repeat (PPR-like) superfamily protein [Actinidia rufa]|uniref:Pentatricopeptide repeat (PPR-like) superfamily protein n=1 Tax=Actinidia rufa TaxID=165716 RepID=A0A7J0GIA2_9ERIC|nr:pentatricopeptide repeat (PPR-like) superfamily protein [Actinidia rufa]